MQATSETYSRILRTSGMQKQHRAIVNGVVYGEEKIFGVPSISRELFGGNPGPRVGACPAGELELVLIYRGEEIPRMAKVELQTRLVTVDLLEEVVTQASEWIPKGTFLIDTRAHKRLSGLLTITAFDAMMLANQIYLPEGETGEWPRGADTVVADIAQRMGVQIDSRTALDPTIMVPYPNDYTMREVLGYIAVAHGGNFIITDAGKLRLVPLWSIPTETHYLVDQHGDAITFGTERARILLSDTRSVENPNVSGSGTTYLGREVADLDSSPEFAPYSKVVFWYDDEEAFVAGDDTGRVLEADCPFATQEIAEKVLASVKGYNYRPYEAVRAILDPAAELGDGVTVNGVYSVLARIDTEFNALMVSTVSAPADEEIGHEIPYMSATQLALKRKLTLGKMYNNVTITQKEGFQAFEVDEDGNKTLRAKIGGGLFVLYDDRGRERLYFDPDTRRYKFVGDLDISGGNINMSDGVIEWGENDPASGMLDADDAKTLISEELVRSPTIVGGQFYALKGSQYYAKMLGDAFALMNKDSDVPRAVLQATESMVELILGAGSDLDGINGRLYVQKGVEGGHNVARVRYIDANGQESTVEFTDEDGLSVDSEVGIKFYGTVDFSGADVVGLPAAQG